MAPNGGDARATPTRPDTAEMREWLDDFAQDMFNVACLRCNAPFQADGYAVAAPAEFYGILDWVREAADEIDRLRQVLHRAFIRTVADYDFEREDGSPGWHEHPLWQYVDMTDDDVVASLRSEW